MDRVTKEQRSRIMSSIRGKDTKPEMRLRRALHAEGLRYRIRKQLPGRPDIVFGPARLAVFVQGCWWHRCPKHFRMPESNVDFWRAKFDRNVERDRQVATKLRRMGWSVLHIWEHDVNGNLEASVRRVKASRRRRLRKFGGSA